MAIGLSEQFQWFLYETKGSIMVTKNEFTITMSYSVTPKLLPSSGLTLPRFVSKQNVREVVTFCLFPGGSCL